MTHAHRIASALADAVGRFRGADGSDWLRRLPGILDDLAARWRIRIGEPYDYASINYVAPAECADGEPAVLKVEWLLHEYADEERALRCCGGRGSVRLIESAPEVGALLLERADPGTGLDREPCHEAASDVAADCMRELWRPACEADGAVTVERWALGLDRMARHYHGRECPIPPAAIARAEWTFAELAAMPDRRLLHGDLHHFNILRAQRRPWLVVDPKGAIGQRAYEVGPFIANRCDGAPDRDAVLRICLDRLAHALHIDRSLLAACTLAHAVLSAWWTVEDTGDLHGDALRHIESAERVDRTRR